MDTATMGALIVVFGIVGVVISITIIYFIFKRYIERNSLNKWTNSRNSKQVIVIHSRDGRVVFTEADIDKLNAQSQEGCSDNVQQMVDQHFIQRYDGSSSTISRRGSVNVRGYRPQESRFMPSLSRHRTVHMTSPQIIDAPQIDQPTEDTHHQDPEVKQRQPGERFEHIID